MSLFDDSYGGVAGLERVAEELMGRRRWKQYQDTLYSGTRSSESATAQPHHRLYPALSSSCNPVSGSLDQIGPQLHHPASSSLPSAVASTVLTTATTTTTTTTPTALASGAVKLESLQRHHLQNHHHHLQGSSVQDRHLQPQQQEDPRRLRPGEIKVETAEEEPTDGVAREDATTRTTDTATSTTAMTGTATTTATAVATATTTPTTTTATGTIATKRRRNGRRQNDGEDVDGEEDGDENENEETGRGQNEAEKRLKLDEDADRPAISPLRTENDRATRDHPTANATDTEGTKVGTIM